MSHLRCDDEESPLKHWELLKPVLSLLDTKTLKSCRLVSKFWKKEVGCVLSFKCWITVWILPIRPILPSSLENCNKFEDLKSILEGSSDPSLFFGRLRVCGLTPSGDELEKLLRRYGKFLNSFEFNLTSRGSPSVFHRTGAPSYIQQFILKLLSRWSPKLEEFHLIYSPSHRRRHPLMLHTLLKITLNPDRPLSLKRIALKMQNIEESFEDFLLQIIQLSPELKWLEVNKLVGNDRFFLQIMNLLNIWNPFETLGHLSIPNSSHSTWIFEFSTELITLTIHSFPTEITYIESG